MPGWECLEPGCRDIGMGMTDSAAQKAAEEHTKRTQHGTYTFHDKPKGERDV